MDFLKFLLLILYIAFLVYAFSKGRQLRMRRKEKKFQEKLCGILNIEALPLNKKQTNVNWSKVYKKLKEIEPSDEINEMIEMVNERRKNIKKQKKSL